jgi:hypothetical protein
VAIDEGLNSVKTSARFDWRCSLLTAISVAAPFLTVLWGVGTGLTSRASGSTSVITSLCFAIARGPTLPM